MRAGVPRLAGPRLARMSSSLLRSVLHIASSSMCVTPAVDRRRDQEREAGGQRETFGTLLLRCRAITRRTVISSCTWTYSEHTRGADIVRRRRYI